MSIRTGMLATAIAVLLLTMTATIAAANGDDYYRDREYDGRAYRDHQQVQWYQGPYATFFLGAATGGEIDIDDTFEPDLETGWLVGGTIGYDNIYAHPGGDFRLEAEISYRGQDVSGFPFNVNLTTMLGNIWYDIALWGRLVPYAGAGFGIGFYSDDVSSDSGFAWQLGGGVNYHLGRRYALGFNYRYLLAYFKVNEEPGSPDLNYSAHQMSVSLGYKF